MNPITTTPTAPATSTPAWATSLADLKLEELPDLDFIVDGMLPVGLTLLAAKPKMGKSFMAMQLCLSVTSGSPFLGRETKKGKALYVSLEDPKRRLRDRAAEFDACPVVPENLDFATTAPKLDDGLLDLLSNWLDSAEDPRLIVIDTLARVMPSAPGRKSDYLHMSEVLDPLQRLAFDRNIGILVVHHATKSEDTADVFDQILGSTALIGVADALLFLNKSRPATQASLDITGRDIEEDTLQLVREGPWWTTIATPPEAALRLTPEKMEILNAVRVGSHTTSEIAGAVGKTYNTANKHANELERLGHLTKNATGRFQLSEEAAILLGGRSGSGGTGGNQQHETTTASMSLATPLPDEEVRLVSTNGVLEAPGAAQAEDSTHQELPKQVIPPPF